MKIDSFGQIICIYITNLYINKLKCINEPLSIKTQTVAELQKHTFFLYKSTYISHVTAHIFHI